MQEVKMEGHNTLLRVGVIGCGTISYEHLPFLGSADSIHLVGVCDFSKASAEFAKRRFRADEAFFDARDMLEKAKPEVVHVLTPPHTHRELVALCLKAGAHVICEKPMTGSAVETMDLLEQAAANQR